MTTRMLRLASLVTTAMLAAAAPAAAQEKVCRGQHVPKPPPTEAEKEQANLESYAAQRAEFGFRHDRAIATMHKRASVCVDAFDGPGTP